MGIKVNEDYFEQQIQENISLNKFKQVVEQLRVFISNNKSNTNLVQLFQRFQINFEPLWTQGTIIRTL